LFGGTDKAYYMAACIMLRAEVMNMPGRKQVRYSFEHGDETLPHLKDLVSEVEDPEKTGIYFWNDAFINYVDRYNIPVPEEFRNHILKKLEV
jgi:hypothetical protein